MIPEQQLWALGYEGAAIALTEDYRSNRHIAASKTKTLCGKPMVKSGFLYTKDGKRFLGYKPNSFDKVYGFYGAHRCKECLRRYLRHRLSPKGEKMLRLYRARLKLRLPIRAR
jgi:hypothetical protein